VYYKCPQSWIFFGGTMDSISCSICLDLLKDPVTIPCGHSYCKGCIKEYWSLDDQKGIHSCPQCRQTFTPRPALNRNIMLAELVEKLKTDFKTVPSVSCFPGPEYVKYDHDDSAAAAEMTEKQVGLWIWNIILKFQPKLSCSSDNTQGSVSHNPQLVMAAAEVHFHHEPKTRVEFLENYCHLTLDPNSAYQHLRLSECNREVSWSDKALSYSDHPDRFTDHYQVLCKEDLSGTRYCEVDRRGECEVAITYRSISRKGGLECCFGSNDQSWSLVCRNSSCSYWHNKNRTDIPVPCSTRVGVYLDSRAGTLAFYSVPDTMTLLHRVQTTFTEDLCAGFWVGPGCGSSVALC
uniref:RING-type domain-containing protein n=1 Tax=Oncorhynchus tshawytscha TaxID=74940 RepID=A0AAZ3RG00_ONCTS